MLWITGVNYRIPLFELVFHDTTLSRWFWADASNKYYPVWGKKDLFSYIPKSASFFISSDILYGTSPSYVVNDTVWNTYKLEFVSSYQNTVPLAGLVKMKIFHFV